jgi:anhydro-N-acetylmuramic acid kinase
VEKVFMPVIEDAGLIVIDKLATCTEHFAVQISNSVISGKEILVTGGGAFNAFLIERLKKYSDCNWHVPEDILVHYKEAMIFAFLGVLRWRNEINCLSSVTGASRDSSCGIIIK